MGLPDRDSASTWGGKLLVDRDGTEIGTCTQIFLDDATGLPEWAQADLSGGPGVVPLMDAAVAGDRVRVAVRRTEVVEAPRVDDPLHISEDEEERLYRHYGITFSREDSESLLPVDGPVDGPPTESPAAAEPATADPIVEHLLTGPVATTPGAAGESTASTSDASTSPVYTPTAPTSADTPDVRQAPGNDRGGLLPALGAGTVGVLAAVAAAIFWWRRRQQMPPTRKELLAARARAASLALTAKKEQVATSAAPLLQRGRRLSAAAGEQAAVQARAAAERAAVQARVAAERAAVQARAAAQQAAAVGAAARTVRLQRVPQQADLAPQPAERPTRARVFGALPALGGFAAGYAARARAGRGGTEPLDAGTSGEGRPLHRMAGRVQARVTDAARAGNAQLSQRGSAVADRVRRRSGGDEEAPLSDG